MTDPNRGVPVAPSLPLPADVVQPPDVSAHVTRRTAVIAGWAIAVGITAAFAAQALSALIGLITNLAFYQRF